MGTNTVTRRGFVKSAGMAPLLIGAAMATDARVAAAAVDDADPYSTVDPELAAALKKFPANRDAPNAGNLAACARATRTLRSRARPRFNPARRRSPGLPGRVTCLF